MGRKVKWLLGLVLLGGVAGIAVSGCWSLSQLTPGANPENVPATGVTWENFERLRSKMKLEDVEAVMGRPPDKTNRGPSEFSSDWHIWYGDGCEVHVEICRLFKTGIMRRFIVNSTVVEEFFFDRRVTP
jgi:hypothetical protein